MLDQLKNPPIYYRLSPYWVWDANPDPAELHRQAREMHSKGVGGFTVYVRGQKGRPAEEHIDRAGELAARLGMQFHEPQEASPPFDLPPILGAKAASSLLHTELFEQFPPLFVKLTAAARIGGPDWSLSLEQLKQSVDEQACLGRTLFCPEAFYYSVVGGPYASPLLGRSGTGQGSAYPVSQFYQATYWRNYRHFSDYASRLAYVASAGNLAPQAAVLRPGEYPDALDSVVAEWLEATCETLMAEHVVFDVLDESALCRARCEDGTLVLNQQTYEVVILPPMAAVSYEAAAKLQAFAEDDGKVIGMLTAPAEDSRGDRHSEVREAIESVFAEAPEFRLDLTRPSDLGPALRHALSQSIKPNVSVRRGGDECTDIWCTHRSGDGLDIFLLANRCSEAREARVSLRCDGAPYMVNLETGDITALPNCTQQGNRTVLLHRFERFGSLVVAFSGEPAFAVAPPVVEEGQQIALNEEWEFQAEQHNCLTLPAWTFNTLIRENHEVFEYGTTFEVEEVPDTLLLALEDQESFGAAAGRAVFVNGRKVEGKESWTVDVGLRTLDISAYAGTGTNAVRMTVEREGWTGDPVPSPARARLMGRFGLGDDRRTLKPDRKLLRNGSWTDQGYPYYSGTGTYRQPVYVPEFARGQRVIIRADAPADMVEFVINGAIAAVRPWAPFEADITPLVKPGVNLVELRVTNSSANMLISEVRPSGLINGATIFLA